MINVDLDMSVCRYDDLDIDRGLFVDRMINVIWILIED